ncbi:methionyl-tRNA formyltransferase [Campylobacter volucris]|uniref:Methionyl-tRNA formyltransferase n=1 Tax=Campylobacter volucris TaxID=1031542 RepID=A0AAF1D1K3_9BACT|nr:methionyl-tRNA formyltransferase [Campylobacter volucris]AJC93525.1 10-formyltetrahydrofolate:L-methionyl-tRNA(fMet) N-formyltransferase [Campylobacter volucris LMG 24379]KAB0579243.1 methionyl-tRNA formyltransferase [Campylobacter volucris]QBL14083.1 methionyl-tRNA formyltransferase [Campylobacter volucris]QEL07738.1 10-formyltetrahydrofolate:L-methionyl-tRNA(fMet) N-formyltransferase [Campylobacter volucris]TXK68145.1 methionyl-tRNA formyltransferase [Campylobacter volucris]
MKNIIFMGTPSYATCILKELIKEGFNIQALFTQSDKPVGRKQILTPSDTKKFILENNLNIKIYTPKSLKDENIIKDIKDLKPDFIVVAAYGKILPKEILDIAPCINLHASLLPKYRGASPIQSAILNADKISGVCSMLMEEGLDSGAVLESVEFNIEGKKSNEIFDIFSNLAAKLCVSTLNNFYKITPKIQDESKVSFCKKIKKEDGLIELNEASVIYQKFLAFYPWPGIFLQNGLKFLDIELFDKDSLQESGKILNIENNGFLLACKKGVLKIKILQESGKKALDGKTYLNGKRLKIGDNLF